MASTRINDTARRPSRTRGSPGSSARIERRASHKVVFPPLKRKTVDALLVGRREAASPGGVEVALVDALNVPGVHARKRGGHELVRPPPIIAAGSGMGFSPAGCSVSTGAEDPSS